MGIRVTGTSHRGGQMIPKLVCKGGIGIGLEDWVR